MLEEKDISVHAKEKTQTQLSCWSFFWHGISEFGNALASFPFF